MSETKLISVDNLTPEQRAELEKQLEAHKKKASPDVLESEVPSNKGLAKFGVDASANEPEESSAGSNLVALNKPPAKERGPVSTSSKVKDLMNRFLRGEVALDSLDVNPENAAAVTEANIERKKAA